MGDADLVAPQPFTILRSVGQWVPGGFLSTTTSIEASGPVQRASDKELNMVPEGDIVEGMMAFWATVTLYVTRGAMASPGATQGCTPQETVLGSGIYTLDPVPPITGGKLFIDGVFKIPGVDYTLSGYVLTLTTPVYDAAVLYFEWPAANIGTAASDILVYDTVQYRVLHVKHYPGSGYYKALATRMAGV